MKNNNIIPGFDDIVNENLKINLKKIDYMTLYISLNGFIDTYNSSYFQKKLSKITKNNYNQLIFECENLNYLSSTGISCFIKVLKECKSNGGNIVLQNLHDKVLEILNLLGFSQFFILTKNEQESIDKLKENIVCKIFPKIFSCPICSKILKTSKSGTFKCKECKSILVIKDDGEVILG